MKKTIALILAAVLLLSVMCCFTSCDNKKEESVRIGFAAPDATHGWVAGVAYYAEKYCNSNGYEYKLTTASDAEEMTANLDELVKWKADVIVTWPQWSGMEEAVQAIINNGIPVVAFDVDILCGNIHKVTGNNFDMGYYSAEYIVKNVGEGATIAVMDVPSSGSVAKLRKEGFYRYLSDIGYDTSNIFEVVEDGFSRDLGYEDMKKVLAEHDKVDAVFSLDDENSIGFVNAIIEAGREDIKAITGGGGMQEYFRMIADSKYDSLGLASALYSPAMIERAIESAVGLYRGENLDSVIVVPTEIVTKDNVNVYLDGENTVY